MNLIFNAEKLPRTMTREAWRELDRWRRVTTRQLAADTQQRLANLVAYGTTHPEIRARVLDELVYPAVMVVPEGCNGLGLSQLRPGTLHYA